MTAEKVEQFVSLANASKGLEAAELILKITEAPGIFVFGEFLDILNLKELEQSSYAPYYHLLNLFAFGTYTDYFASRDLYPPVNETQLRKLKQLTIVTEANVQKRIPYKQLMEQLHIGSLRELEDLIIDLIYADVIKGKLDQQKAALEVEYTIGRDIRPEQVTELNRALTSWCARCEAVLQQVVAEMVKANERRAEAELTRKKVNEETENIKEMVRAQLTASHMECQKMELEEVGHPDLLPGDTASQDGIASQGKGAGPSGSGSGGPGGKSGSGSGPSGSGASAGSGEKEAKTPRKGMFKGLKQGRIFK